MNDWATHLLAEFVGTMILLLIGNGAIASDALLKTKGNNSGLICVAFGWATAVILASIISSALGGYAHLNPAITVSILVNDWNYYVGSYSLLSIIIIGQIIGAFSAQIILNVFYVKHIIHTISEGENKKVLAMHCTSPTYRNSLLNFVSEFTGTAVLVLTMFSIASWFENLPWMGPIIMGISVLAISISLGSTTGCAINPVRDLIPRIVFQFLPIKGKGDADWNYSWIPVVAPLFAGLFIGLMFLI